MIIRTWLLQLQQYRLLPYLAATYCFTVFNKWYFEQFSRFTASQLIGDKSDRQVCNYYFIEKFNYNNS